MEGKLNLSLLRRWRVTFKFHSFFFFKSSVETSMKIVMNLSPSWALEDSNAEPVSVGLKYGRKGEPEPLKALTGNFQISFFLKFYSSVEMSQKTVMNLSPWRQWRRASMRRSQVWKKRWTWAWRHWLGTDPQLLSGAVTVNLSLSRHWRWFEPQFY